MRAKYFSQFSVADKTEIKNLGCATHNYLFLSHDQAEYKFHATYSACFAGRSTSEGSAYMETMTFAWNRLNSKSSLSRPMQKQERQSVWLYSATGQRSYVHFVLILFSYARTYGMLAKTTKIYCLVSSSVEFLASTPYMPSTTSR